MEAVQNLTKNLNFNIVNIDFQPVYWQVGAIIVLLFLLVLSLAQFRHHTVHWSFKGGIAGIFFGFLFALILEGFLIIGGKTALTELLGWKNAPKPVATALDVGREKLVGVLGITDEIPSSLADDGVETSEEALKILQNLAPSEIKKIRALICEP